MTYATKDTRPVHDNLTSQNHSVPSTQIVTTTKATPTERERKTSNNEASVTRSCILSRGKHDMR